jgi:hypothetical protein
MGNIEDDELFLDVDTDSDDGIPKPVVPHHLTVQATAGEIAHDAIYKSRMPSPLLDLEWERRCRIWNASADTDTDDGISKTDDIPKPEVEHGKANGGDLPLLTLTL